MANFKRNTIKKPLDREKPKITDFDALRISVASPEQILEWSYGEVLKPND